MRLNQQNIEKKLQDYLKQVNSIKLPVPGNSVLAFLYSIKRTVIDSGPYPGVSLFEIANRVLSDMVILVGIKQLLSNPFVGDVRLPFDEYEVSLGVEGGYDLRAIAEGHLLLGEAFNVAPSFFQSKKWRMAKKLKSEEADYRLILFNADAVKNPQHYLEISEPSMLYLPVGM